MFCSYRYNTLFLLNVNLFLQILFGGTTGDAIERHASSLDASEAAAITFDAAATANEFGVKGFHAVNISDSPLLST